MGRKERQKLRNRLSILIVHLLKWEYQPQRRSRSWLVTIRVQRRDILRLFNQAKAIPWINFAEYNQNGEALTNLIC